LSTATAATTVELLQGDFLAIAKRLHFDCRAILKRLRGEYEAVSKRLPIDCDRSVSFVKSLYNRLLTALQRDLIVMRKEDDREAIAERLAIVK
jgi:hypothetical protein